MTILEIFQKLHDEAYSIPEQTERRERDLAIWRARARLVEARASFDDSFGSHDPHTTEVVIRSMVDQSNPSTAADDIVTSPLRQPLYLVAA